MSLRHVSMSSSPRPIASSPPAKSARRPDRRPAMEAPDGRVVPAGTWTPLAASGAAPPGGGGAMMILSEGSTFIQHGSNPAPCGFRASYTWSSTMERASIMRLRHRLSQSVSLNPPAGRKAREGRKSKRWLVLEALEDRSVPTVSILNGGGLGYVGNGGGGPPDVTGAAGPSSYIESNNTSFTVFSKSVGTQLATQSAGQFFFGTAAGDGSLTQITPTSQRIADVTMVFDNLMGGTGRFILGATSTPT